MEFCKFFSCWLSFGGSWRQHRSHLCFSSWHGSWVRSRNSGVADEIPAETDTRGWAAEAREGSSQQTSVASKPSGQCQRASLQASKRCDSPLWAGIEVAQGSVTMYLWRYFRIFTFSVPREKNKGGMCNYSPKYQDIFLANRKFLEQKAEAPEQDAQPLCGMTLAGKKASLRKSKI